MPMRFKRMAMPIPAKPLPTIAMRGVLAGRAAGIVSAQRERLPRGEPLSNTAGGVRCARSTVVPVAAARIVAAIIDAATTVVPVVRALTEVDTAVVAPGCATARFVIVDIDIAFDHTVAPMRQCFAKQHARQQAAHSA